MARIPEQQVDRIKSEVPILHLVEQCGIELKKKGKDHFGHCPFHDDRTPSLSVTPGTNLWHCLGACDAGGSVIDWEMRYHQVTFREAVERLQGHLGLTGGLMARPPADEALPSLAADADDQAMLNRVIDFYHATLKQNPEALAYLDSRGLNNPELINHFRLGYANRTLGVRLPDKQRKAGAEIRSQLESIGIYRKSGHEHFNGSLVIPVMDKANQVQGIYGRKIGQRLRKGTPKHLYLPGPHQGVFNPEAFKAKEIILCESLIDALTFWNAGFRHVTSAYGVAGFTDELMQAFKDHTTERVLIAYDRDEAGNEAAKALAKKLMKAGTSCFRILFPKSMDANSYANQKTEDGGQKTEAATRRLGQVIRKAEWLGNGVAPEIETAAGTRTENAANGKGIPSLAAESDLPETETASPLPPKPPADIEAQVSDEEIIIKLADRRYRIRGLAKNTANNVLNINLLVSCDEALHVDTFNLYSMKPRQSFSRQASIELGVEETVIRKDLGKLLLKLEALQQQVINDASKQKAIKLTDEDQADALALLKDPNLLDRIITDLDACGLVGEDTNKLLGYLACTSRKLKSPLAILIQSTSAAGKSSLMDAVLNLMPEEDKEQYSAMTGQSLYYMGETALKHKILAIAEEEGVQQAAYALKLLQSEGVLTMASTGKDPETGELRTQEYRVEGPMTLFLTTTASDIDEELQNRCIVLTVNESREQTRLIHERQRFEETLEGLLAESDRDDIAHLHRNAQRLLKPVKVVNPFAHYLTFLDDQTRLRRDHKKYLCLIQAIALLHQYQRPIKTQQHNGKAIDYIEVTLKDMEIANKLAHEVLGRSLDELPPQTRRLLGLITTMVAEQSITLKMTQSDYRFSRRELRQTTGFGDTQLRLHLDRLVDMEYLLVHRGSRGQRFVYELLFDGDPKQQAPQLHGLIDIDRIGKSMPMTKTSRGKGTGFAGSSRPDSGANAGCSRGSKNGNQPNNHGQPEQLNEKAPENALIKSNGTSHRRHKTSPTLAA